MDTWEQDYETVTVICDDISTKLQEKLKVLFKSDNLIVICDGEEIKNINLYQKIRPHQCTWYFQNNICFIEMEKLEEYWWPHLSIEREGIPSEQPGRNIHDLPDIHKYETYKAIQTQSWEK